MPDQKLHLLLIEDREDDALLLMRQLKKAGYQLKMQRVETAESMRAALLDSRWDLIVSDFNLPNFNALQALIVARQMASELPFIVVSGAVGEERAVECMRNGAQDFVLKKSLARLPHVIERELGEAKMRFERREALQDLEASVDRLHRTMEGTIKAMALIGEQRDPYTAGHQERVSELAERIAKRMNLSQHDIDGVRLSGLVHDIGKICVPAEILSKPGRISTPEFDLIKLHVNAGYEILRTIDFPWPIADIVLMHHERLDGTGYPRGIGGDQICLLARIIAVSDVVEAMAFHRPYRPALGIERAIREIQEYRQQRYDGQVVDVCIDILMNDPTLFDLQAGDHHGHGMLAQRTDKPLTGLGT